jgi:hypothetical protein
MEQLSQRICDLINVERFTLAKVIPACGVTLIDLLIRELLVPPEGCLTALQTFTYSCIKLDWYKSSILQSELICIAGVVFYKRFDEPSCSVRTGNALNIFLNKEALSKIYSD